jgi:hypothetical protein
LASSDKTNESAGASKVSDDHCVQKDEESCELKSVKSTDLSQRLIHGDVRTEVCKFAVGAFVLALVMACLVQLMFDKGISGSCSIPSIDIMPTEIVVWSMLKSVISMCPN